jgi:hypothetical protein
MTAAQGQVLNRVADLEHISRARFGIRYCLRRSLLVVRYAWRNCAIDVTPFESCGLYRGVTSSRSGIGP